MYSLTVLGWEQIWMFVFYIFDKEDVFCEVLFFYAPYQWNPGHCGQACIINAMLKVCNIVIPIVISHVKLKPRLSF